MRLGEQAERGQILGPRPGMPKPTYAGKRSSKELPLFLQEALAERPLPRRGTGAPRTPQRSAALLGPLAGANGVPLPSYLSAGQENSR